MSDSEKLADDFKLYLKDLTSNDRYAISNLTVIAKESVQHADAISTVILDHIIETNRNHKLPALYVLDSIVKNIGNPYTLFISPRLYNVFMEAYCVVDSATRRKLDEMLKTWKSPVPGSTDPRPVFPPDITKRIENALIQWKTKTLQQEQEQQRAQQELLRRRNAGAAAVGQWRNTPTPPQNDPRYQIPVSQGYLQYPQQQYPVGAQLPRPVSQNHYQAPGATHHSSYNMADPSTDIHSLYQDTENLIEQAKADWAQSPYDDAIRVRLKALLDLQSLLKSQQLPLEQLQAVRAQLSVLQLSTRPHSNSYHPSPPNATAYPDTSTYSAPIPSHTFQSSPGANAPSFSIPPNPPIVTQSTYTGPQQAPSTNFLAGLLSSAARNRPLVAPPPVPTTTAENPLIAQLRAAGLISSSDSQQTTPIPNIAAPPPPPPPVLVSSQTPLSTHLTELLSKVRAVHGNEIQLTSTSLKQPRPHLINKLYDEQPNQCLTCGRRFPGSEEGRTQKARHLDWHFKTNQRLVEAAQRGQSRSWYVDEKEWIKYRDDAEGNEVLAANGQAGGNGSTAEGGIKDNPRNRFIPVPSDNAVRNAPCPICQERFEQSWNEELQDFVFIDAVKVGGRIYHASCYADYRKDEGNTPARNSTPDSVLGKRKADVHVGGPSPAKVRREGDD